MKNIEIKLKIVYLISIVLLFLHAIEEVIGKAPFIMDSYNSLTNYWLVHSLLFFVVIILFIFTLNKRRWTYNLNYIYALVIISDGIWHIINKSIAGVYTAISLVLIGLLLIYYLWKNKKA